ncbi:putative FAD synthetase [Xylariales sp. PMI_506]|nr:putative FAD synthetase [Xylariales sp. PMI_506]
MTTVAVAAAPTTSTLLTIVDGGSIMSLTNGTTLTPVERSGANSAHEGRDEDKEAASMRALCEELEVKVAKFLEQEADDEITRGVQKQVRIAKEVIDDALTRYSPDELSISYNGGKDCLVMLVLILACLPAHFPPSSSSPLDISESKTKTKAFPSRLQAIYIRPPKPFPEVDEFVETSSRAYHLDLATSDLPMKPALEGYLLGGDEQHPGSRSGVRAVFVGTRRTDPHGARLTFFDETDGDWPRFMRVHPVIDWHYREVWGFLRALDIPYCSLYDKGYTSLGGTDDTLPNPALKVEGEYGSFRPAHELIEDNEERLGRDR